MPYYLESTYGMQRYAVCYVWYDQTIPCPVPYCTIWYHTIQVRVHNYIQHALYIYRLYITPLYRMLWGLVDTHAWKKRKRGRGQLGPSSSSDGPEVESALFPANRTAGYNMLPYTINSHTSDSPGRISLGADLDAPTTNIKP